MNFFGLYILLINLLLVYCSLNDECQSISDFFSSYELTNLPNCCESKQYNHQFVCEDNHVTEIALTYNSLEPIIDFSTFPILPNLKKLALEGPIFKDIVLSSRFFEQPNLQELNITNSNIVSFPSIDSSCQLQTLNLYENQLTSFPDQITNCSGLKFLDISNNVNVQTLPKSISNLKNLETLYLGYTSLTSLPVELYSLNIKDFDIDNIPNLKTEIHKFPNKVEICDFRNVNIICYEENTCEKFVTNEEPRQFSTNHMYTICDDSSNSAVREVISNEEKSNKVIILLVVAIVVLLLIILLIFCCIKRNKKEEKKESEMEEDIYISPISPISELVKSSSEPNINTLGSTQKEMINTTETDTKARDDNQSLVNEQGVSIGVPQAVNESHPRESTVSESHLASSSDLSFTAGAIPNINTDDRRSSISSHVSHQSAIPLNSPPLNSSSLNSSPLNSSPLNSSNDNTHSTIPINEPRPISKNLEAQLDKEEPSFVELPSYYESINTSQLNNNNNITNISGNNNFSSTNNINNNNNTNNTNNNNVIINPVIIQYQTNNAIQKPSMINTSNVANTNSMGYNQSPNSTFYYGNNISSPNMSISPIRTSFIQPNTYRISNIMNYNGGMVMNSGPTFMNNNLVNGNLTTPFLPPSYSVVVSSGQRLSTNTANNSNNGNPSTVTTTNINNPISSTTSATITSNTTTNETTNNNKSTNETGSDNE